MRQEQVGQGHPARVRYDAVIHTIVRQIMKGNSEINDFR
jgi:hypothetical protein